MTEQRLIDANELITAFPCGETVRTECVRATIGHMPTIEERKRGKWINANEGKWNTIEVLKCSVCGEMDYRMHRTDNFCPNCGADMRGDAHE